MGGCRSARGMDGRTDGRYGDGWVGGREEGRKVRMLCGGSESKQEKREGA